MAAEREKNLHLMRELDYLRVQNQGIIIANSPAMKAVISNINAVASTDTTVVIYGESGTGKDIMARLIHDRSQRSDDAFISINCAAIPDSLLESELFGYEKGSFTGALSKGKIGLFEAAKGGTVFLDEIGEMPMALQSKLLRAIENREIRRVGGVVNIPINIRIICATNENLREMVREGKFREDLFYRLNVFPITLPRLRDRPDDIIPLAEYFLSGLNEKYNTHKVFSDVTLKTMLEHPWPGNIRELRNVVERIYVISPANELIFTPVPTASYSPEAMLGVSGEAAQTALPHYDSLKQFTEDFEKRYIEQVLDECGGRIQEAADKLGIHRSALWRKLHKRDG
jgi:transcriptional regulator with PAS, ATPase and Fis domain